MKKKNDIQMPLNIYILLSEYMYNIISLEYMIQGK
jgi:hypothetical protein